MGPAGQPVPLLWTCLGNRRSHFSRWPLGNAWVGRNRPARTLFIGFSDHCLKWPISHDGGGGGGFWSRTSLELFYPTFFSPLRIMVAPYRLEGGRFQPGQPIRPSDTGSRQSGGLHRFGEHGRPRKILGCVLGGRWLEPGSTRELEGFRWRCMADH